MVFWGNDASLIDITNHADEVYRLYARKSGSYFVNKVTRFGINALRPDLIERARKMTRVRGENHPWRSMSDEELLRSAGLILTDEHTQQEGITLLEFCQVPRTKNDMQEYCGIKSDRYFRKNILTPMLQKGLIQRTIPDKPQSPKQKYIAK
jgi:ATP-dependent DNA helicase RecG